MDAAACPSRAVIELPIDTVTVTGTASDPVPGDASVTAPPAPGTPPVLEFTPAFEFTGGGHEYFRIWVVNLLLSLVTLGIYSAWAKVRKTRYFWQNTRLAGHAFDFHGRPVAILRGRILALLLFVAYSWSFQFSLTAGFVTLALLCALAPWLVLKSQQFRLGNTSHRGLRFGFRATLGDAYRTTLPPLVLWLGTVAAGAVLAYAQTSSVLVAIVALPLLMTLLWPWMHQRLKAFLHGHASYGDRRFRFQPATKAFYKAYLKAAGVGIVLVIVGVAVGASIGMLLQETHMGGTVAGFVGAAFALLAYAFVLPYLSVRIQQIVWHSTTLDDVHFETAIRVWPLIRLVFVNIGLTLVTLGLYWPFAAVSFARYRITCMRLSTPAPLGEVVAAAGGGSGNAIGDAAGDTFGIDIGL